MNAVRRLVLGGQQAEGDATGGQAAAWPPPDATVYPVWHLDDVAANQMSVPHKLMRFNDVLDANKLRDSLVRLLEIGDWKKLAGRFVRNPETKKLEIHVPPKFTDEMPPILYSHVVHERMSIDEHPLGQQLPAVCETLRLQPGVGHFGDFCFGPGVVKGVEEAIQTRAPQLGLRVTSFEDATLVDLSWSHVVMDGLAFRSFLTAWNLVLAGREDEVPAVRSPFTDAAAPLWSEDTHEEDEEDVVKREPYLLADKLLSGWGFAGFAAGMVWSMFWQNKVTTRTLVLPAWFMAELRAEACSGLPEGVPFVSDGDIICAWWTRLLVGIHGWTGPVTQLNVVDMRSRVPSLFGEQGEAAYLQNLAYGILTFFDSSEFGQGAAASRMGAWAARVRESVQKQTTAEQIFAFMRLSVPLAKQLGRPVVFGKPTSKLAVVSNWLKARFIVESDFGPAVVRAGKEGDEPSRQNPAGGMLWEICGGAYNDPAVRNTAVIMGKDHGGNYWLCLCMAEATLQATEEMLAKEQAARRRG